MREVVLVLTMVTMALADVRSCFKCRGRDSCLRPEYATVETCSPDVQRCVTKYTLSKVTGARLSEQYCGSPEMEELRGVLLEDRCYPHDHTNNDRRTLTTFCYCSRDLCNSSVVPGAWRAFMCLTGLLAAFRWKGMDWLSGLLM